MNLGCGCPKCQKQKISKKTRFSGDEFLKKHNLNKLYSISGYIGAGKKASFTCLKCGHVRITDPNTVARHKDCPYCTGQMHRLTDEEFLKRVKSAHGDEYEILGKYQKLTEKIEVLHKNCGKSFFTRPDNFIGTENKESCGCPYCMPKSKGEKAIEQILNEKHILYKLQCSFSECKDKKPLPFDFALLDITGAVSALIEFDGIQHYKSGKKSKIYTDEKLKITQKHDNIKTKFCETHKIPLYRIPYSKLKNIRSEIENILLERSTTIENNKYE